MYSNRQNNLETGNASDFDDLMSEKDAPECVFIHELIVLTRETFLNKKGIPPAFLYEKEHKISAIQVPDELLDSQKGKDELSALIKNSVELIKPESFCLITESWIYKVKDHEKEEAEQLIADYKNGINNPNVIREECVTFIFTQLNTDASYSHWCGIMPIHRDSDSNINKFDSVRWIKQGTSKQLEGRFVF